MSGKIEMSAINIALLPDRKSAEKCLVLSDSLTESGGQGLLGTHAIPHLTLWMGLVKNDEVHVLLEWVRSIDLKILLHRPEINQIESRQSDQPILQIKFEKNDLIQQLHEAAHRRASGHFQKVEMDEDMFEGEGISISTREYTSSFHDEYSLENYAPHITIGYGNSDFFIGEDPIVVDRVAIFRMGNSCTCVKELIK